MTAAIMLSIVYHLADQNIPATIALPIEPADRVIVDKSERQMLLMSGDRVVKEYDVALGANPVGDKDVAGDSRTPEGEYTIDWRQADSSFHRALHISYPDEQDRNFAAAINRSPGHGIMIHGQPNDLGWLERLTRAADWTDGCIAVSNREIEQIWDAVPDGAPIIIHP